MTQIDSSKIVVHAVVKLDATAVSKIVVHAVVKLDATAVSKVVVHAVVNEIIITPIKRPRVIIIS